MYTVYVLQDENGKTYKGLTNNLARRFSEHKSKNGGKTTSSMTNLRIVYTENCASLEEARKREVYLKSSAGRRFIKTKLRP